ncbi:uncharacterized protein RCC_09393 [Ramularia collo-cygni]|uniref:DUF1760-domain-containing protein n=1 Tax=Ramularia collo-cygni TaxID=112498 RepID=A0A2D3VK06_9PEZI|nr:uncharacterized protein RCC_09393 [Ramularia collo-cygni]CZT23679.1 uncharacterized protein RCC_09393 [Ramularia collo-cygni]
MADSESPLIQALPPVSDYITYLTIVEYNLKPENLPILHKILQDETLTINIGWDLVHLLVPYLPESEHCLQDIARLGNPREVILKVTEVLRLIEYQEDEADEQDAHDDDAQAGASVGRSQADTSTYPLKTATVTGSVGTAQAVELPPPLPLEVSQFVALLSMLEILHPRIKTKYPSRFLSTSLQAILASFSNSQSHREEMVQAIVRAVRAVSGVQRPALPSRKSSAMLGSVPKTTDSPAADPEGTAGLEVSAEEKALEKKLLQAFIAHVLEEYMLNLSSHDEVPGMAWCSRIMEKVHPERNIPASKTFASRFAEEESLHRRIDAIGQLVMLSQDLKLADNDLLTASMVDENMPETAGYEDEPPASAEDIPLSRLGSLLLYSARQASTILYDRQSYAGAPFELFPHHQELLKHGLSSPGMGTGQLGTEPEALIDSVLALGLVSLERNQIGEPRSDEQFNEYLQVIALLSSNCPNSNLRGHAHYLTTTVLRSQPDDAARLSFIRDTLEHCPFENLKVAAVGWIKGETIEANPMVSMHSHSHETESSESVFAKPLALDSLAPFLFPSLQAELNVAPIQDAWMTFQTNISFYLSSLNFLFLLLHAEHIRESLAIADLWNDADIAASFLQPLRDARKRFGDALVEGGDLATEKTESIIAELALLEETVSRVTAAAAGMNK